MALEIGISHPVHDLDTCDPAVVAKRAEELGFNVSVLAFAVVASALAAILFGLAPALALSSGGASAGLGFDEPRLGIT